MESLDEHTALLHSQPRHHSIEHLQINYPNVTVKELIQKVREWLNSTADHQCLPDLVALGGDAAFYALVKAILEVPHDKRDVLQSWAIKVLYILLEPHDHNRIRLILLYNWEGQGSALDIILKAPATTILLCKPVQAGIHELWKTGPQMTDSAAFNFKQWITRYMLLYFAKWRSPKYQCILQFVTGCIYIALYLATVANQNYTSFPPHVYEYVFYVFALSDILLETLKFLKSPWKNVGSVRAQLGIISSYVILVSFIWRILGLTTRSLPIAYQKLHVSYVCLALVSPIMFIRLLMYARPYHAVSRIEITLTRCLVEASWVLALGAIVLAGFWVAVAAINTDKSAWEILQLLALGALFAPEIGETLLYEPQVIGVLMFIYLFLTTILLSSLLTASFLATFLSLRNEIDELVALQFARLTVDALNAGGGTGFGAFIPGILVDTVLVYPFVLAGYLYRYIIRYRMTDAHQRLEAQKFERTSRYLNYWRQCVFLVTYAPFFIALLVIELLHDTTRYLYFHFQENEHTTVPFCYMPNDV